MLVPMLLMASLLALPQGRGHDKGSIDLHVVLFN